jgi:hypothetical protein
VKAARGQPRGEDGVTWHDVCLHRCVVSVLTCTSSSTFCGRSRALVVTRSNKTHLYSSLIYSCSVHYANYQAVPIGFRFIPDYIMKTLVQRTIPHFTINIYKTHHISILRNHN